MRIQVTITLLAVALGGCASIVNDTTQQMKIETKTADGVSISGADCKLTNDYGSFTLKSGETGPVRRSGKDLDISCKSDGQPDASGRAISRANGGMWGNILFGGGVGAIIDHEKGTAYTYPTWIQLIFGQSLVFDRTSEKEGAPVPATVPVAANK